MGGGLVEDDHVRCLEQEASEGYALFLATGEPVSAVADDGVETIGERLDEGQDLRTGDGFVELLFGRVGLCVEKVRPDRLMEQVCVLGHDADRFPQGGERGVADVDAVQAYGA